MKLEKKRLVLVQETLRTLTSQTTPSMQATDVSCFGLHFNNDRGDTWVCEIKAVRSSVVGQFP